MKAEMRQKLARENFAEKNPQSGATHSAGQNLSAPQPAEPTPCRPMKTRVRKYAAEEAALKQGMEAKSKEFVAKGAEVYAKV